MGSLLNMSKCLARHGCGQSAYGTDLLNFIVGRGVRCRAKASRSLIKCDLHSTVALKTSSSSLHAEKLLQTNSTDEADKFTADAQQTSSNSIDQLLDSLLVNKAIGSKRDNKRTYMDFARSPAAPAEPPLAGVQRKQQSSPSLPTWAKSDFDQALLQNSANTQQILKIAQGAIKDDEMTPQRALTVLLMLSQASKQAQKQQHEEQQQLPSGNAAQDDFTSSPPPVHALLRDNPSVMNVLLSILKESNHNLSSHHLMLSLEVLMSLGLSPDHAAIDALQNEILYRVKKFAPPLLVKLAMIQSKYDATPIQRRVLDEVYQILRRRYVELSKPDEILNLLSIPVSRLPADIRVLLENRCLALSDQFTITECVTALDLLSKNKRRPLPLLRAVTSRITQPEVPLTLKRAVDIGHVLANLSFHSEAVMEKITQCVQSEATWCNNNDNDNSTNGGASQAEKEYSKQLQPEQLLHAITNVLIIFGKLRYRDDEAVHFLCSQFRRLKQHATLYNWAALVRTCSRIAPAACSSGASGSSIISTEFPDLLDEAVEILRAAKSQVSSKKWLDIVCVLCELSRAPRDIVLDVLGGGIKQFAGNESSPSAIKSVACRLANVAAYCALDLNDSNDPKMNELAERNFLTSPKDLVGSRASEHLITIIRRTLNAFAPRDRYFDASTGYQLGYSTTVAELIVSVSNSSEPVPMNPMRQDLLMRPGGAPFGTAAERDTNLVNVLVLAFEFSDYAWPTNHLLGIHEKAIEQFEKLGFAVAQISHKDFLALTTDVERVRHVKQRIQEAVQFKLKNTISRHQPQQEDVNILRHSST